LPKINKKQKNGDHPLAGVLTDKEYESLTPEERAALLSVIDEIAEEGDSETLQDLYDEDYDEIPVDPETFLLDPYYLGDAVEVFDVLKKDFIDLFNDPTVFEVILAGGIGYGKSFLGALIEARMIYELLCLKSPQSFYSLSPSSTITIMNLSITGAQAKTQIFAELSDMVRLSPWFQRNYPPDKRIKSSLNFPKNIVAMPGNSTELSAIGKTIFGGIVDEANFMARVMDSSRSREATSEFHQAEVLVNALRTRLKSRFVQQGHIPGKLVIISSKTTEDAYLERRVKEVGERDTVFVRSYATWETRPRERYMKEEFRVGLGNSMMSSCIIETDADIKPGMEVLSVPMDFYPDFVDDIDRAIRDIAGRSTVAISPLITKRERIYECTKLDLSIKHPYSALKTNLQDGAYFLQEMLVRIDKDGFRIPILHPDAPRYAHVDLAASGDACGVSVCHKAGERTHRRTIPERDVFDRLTGRVITVVEKLPIVYVDFMLQIVHPKGAEIDFAAVRGLFTELREIGIPLAGITYDWWNSKGSLQELNKLGFNATYLSVDRSPAAYYLLKRCIEDRRLVMYYYQPVIDELLGLQDDRRKGKIDHVSYGPNAHKDIADALAGAHHGAYLGIGGWLEPSLGLMDGVTPLGEGQEDIKEAEELDEVEEEPERPDIEVPEWYSWLGGGRV